MADCLSFSFYVLVGSFVFLISVGFVFRSVLLVSVSGGFSVFQIPLHTNEQLAVKQITILKTEVSLLTILKRETSGNTGSLVKLSLWNLQVSLVQEPHGCAYVNERVH